MQVGFVVALRYCMQDICARACTRPKPLGRVRARAKESCIQGGREFGKKGRHPNYIIFEKITNFCIIKQTFVKLLTAFVITVFAK